MHKMRVLCAAAAALVCAYITASPADAQVRVNGSPENVVLVAENATLHEILTSLRMTFQLGLTVQGSTERHFNGTYRGPVREVLARLLDGIDHVISGEADRLQLVLVGANKPEPRVPGIINAQNVRTKSVFPAGITVTAD